MKKVTLLDSSYPINSRNLRILKSLEKYYEVSYISWNRDESKINETDSKESIFTKKSKYGNRKSKLLNLIFFYMFIIKELKRRNPDILITSHWDMFFMGSFLNRKKSYKIIYENLDIPESENKYILKFLKSLESFFLKKTEGMIVASRFFAKKYNHKNFLVFENYPYKLNEEITKKNKKGTEKKTIAYIGTVRYYEVFKNFILAFGNDPNYNIEIFGSGPDEEKIKFFCKENSIKNIKFHGSYDYRVVKELYGKIDLLWAAYPNNSENVKFAISNKFFEALTYNTIGIFSEKTFLGDLVTKEEIGIVVNPYSPANIKDTVNNINLKKIESLKENIVKFGKYENLFWEDNEERLVNYVKGIEKI